MHESQHDASYGEVMGGMWGARALDLDDVPCPGMSDALLDFFKSEGGGCTYGDDMQFLSKLMMPQINDTNCIHHVDGDMSRQIGRLDIPRIPFPETPYRGFIGQPVNCCCAHDLFVSVGCSHVTRSIPGKLASRLNCDPSVLAALGSFLS